MKPVRRSATALAVLFALAASSAAQSSQEELKGKLELKLKEPFASKVPWVLDYADAMKKAKAENKLIFAYFTRSYSP